MPQLTTKSGSSLMTDEFLHNDFIRHTVTPTISVHVYVNLLRISLGDLSRNQLI